MISTAIMDITTLAVDAIVNAANGRLAPGGGVCGAIHDAAGPELASACEDLAPCPTGDARITPGFRLPSRCVIHAVGPVWQGGSWGESELLTSVYQKSFALAKANNVTVIAFPSISTGIYGYPLHLATKIAVTTAQEELNRRTSVEEVIFACFSKAALEAYLAEGAVLRK